MKINITHINVLKAANRNRCFRIYLLAVISSLSIHKQTLAAPVTEQVISPDMFTSEEKATHLLHAAEISEVAARCLQSTYNTHLDFFERHGVSKYFGDRNSKYKTLGLRKSALRQIGKSESLAEEQEPISCIGLTRKCLQEGFAAAGDLSLWQKIDKQLAYRQLYSGIDLQKMLGFLGWKIYYWNPDPSSNARWDMEDQKLNPLTSGKKWNPVWGGHSYNYAKVLSRHSYYGVHVDDSQLLVGFNDSPPDEFRKFRFFVGVAHAGYHVFPGFGGKVIEGHSMRAIDSVDNIQVSEFNPLGDLGGPRWTRSERYRSGTIAVPPQQ